MKVFLSYAVGQLDATIAARLRAVAAAYDISIILPDRTTALGQNIAAEIQKQIKQSDAFIALVTRTAQVASLNQVNLELQTAARAGKPIIALVEQGVPLQGAPYQVVYFDRSDPTAHEAALVNALAQMRQQQQQWKNDLITLGWIAGITLGLVALSDMVSGEK
ncbi:MAG: TIR domain-containing protein [Pyrinomonadaceae bacterium]